MPRIKLTLDDKDYHHLHRLDDAGMLTQRRKFQYARDCNMEYERLFLVEFPAWRRKVELVCRENKDR